MLPPVYFNEEMPENILDDAPPTPKATPTSEASSSSQIQMTPPTREAPPTSYSLSSVASSSSQMASYVTPPTQMDQAPPTSEASSSTHMASYMAPPTFDATPTHLAPPTYYSNDHQNIPVMSIDGYEKIEEPTNYVYQEKGAELQGAELEQQNYSTPTVGSEQMGGPIIGNDVYWHQYNEDDIEFMEHNLNLDGDQIEMVDHELRTLETLETSEPMSQQAELQYDINYHQYDDTGFMNPQNMDYDMPFGEENVDPEVDHKPKPRPQKVSKPRNRKPRRESTAPSNSGHHFDPNQPSTSGLPSYSNTPYIIHGPISNPSFIDTRGLCDNITYELQICGISQTAFAKRVLKRTQGTLSDTLKKPKPWKDLKEVGKQIYIQMAEWLSLRPDERMAKVMEEKAEPKKTDASEKSSDATKPTKKRFQFSQLQKKTLDAVFQVERRPDERCMGHLAVELELEFYQVHNFFMNARRRCRFAENKRDEEVMEMDDDME